MIKRLTDKATLAMQRHIGMRLDNAREDQCIVNRLYVRGTLCCEVRNEVVGSVQGVPGLGFLQRPTVRMFMDPDELRAMGLLEAFTVAWTIFLLLAKCSERQVEDAMKQAA